MLKEVVLFIPFFFFIVAVDSSKKKVLKNILETVDENNDILVEIKNYMSPKVKCKSGWEFFHHTGKCYKRVDEILPMWAAREYCNFMEADLAKIADPKTQSYLTEVIENRNTFIGGIRTGKGNEEWMWLIDNSRPYYFPWQNETHIEPNSFDSDQMCMKMSNVNGLWHDFWCKITDDNIVESFLCESIDPLVKPTCDAGYTFFDHTNKCYKYYDIGLSWTNASTVCQSQGGDLPSVLDQETSDFLTTLTPGYAWIGGYRESPGSDTFLWSDGSPWRYTNWGAGQPNNVNGTQDFVATVGQNKDGEWDDVGGPGQGLYFICQKP